MTKIRIRAAATVLSVVMAASLLSATSANATGSEADDIVQILESVPTEIPVMQDVTTDGATALVAAGSASSDLAAIEDVLDVSVSALGENPLSIELLAAQDAAAVSVSQDGVEVIDNGDNSSTVPLNRADGSLQVVFVIETTDAPTEYAIDVDLPEGTVLTQDEGGALLATGADGQLALGVAPAWAYDAAGTAVPTHYVVQESQITQVIEHTSGDYQYPIVADPWLGQRLFIMASAGLAEFTSQWATVRNSVSLQQQYQCHAVWGRAIIGAGFHWDLELSRPTNSNYLNVAAHRCNW